MKVVLYIILGIAIIVIGFFVWFFVFFIQVPELNIPENSSEKEKVVLIDNWLEQLNSEKKLKELKEISNQFESIFINQILKQARQNKIKNGLFDSKSISTFNSMIDEQYSKILSKKTNFGISDALFNQFKSQVVNERKK